MNEGERERPRWRCGPYPSREAGEEQVGMAAVLALSPQGRRLPVLPALPFKNSGLQILIEAPKYL